MKRVYKVGIFLVVLILLAGCARDGSFSKAGAFEMLKDISKNRNPSVEQVPEDEMSYSEYERMREEQKQSSDE